MAVTEADSDLAYLLDGWRVVRDGDVTLFEPIGGVPFKPAELIAAHRELAYAAGVKAERERVVNWLRESSRACVTMHGTVAIGNCADELEKQP